MKRFTVLLLCTLLVPFKLAAQFTSITNLDPLAASVFATREKQQSKVFLHDGKYWSVLANSTGTHIWRLDGKSWTEVLKLTNKNSRADYVLSGNVIHVLLYSGPSSQFVSAEYDKASATFKPWSNNQTKSGITLETGVQIASVDMDKTGRMWIASSGTDGKINVRWSDAPYTTWSNPIAIAQGVREDDISAVIALPQINKIGVLWSNQKTKKWGFKTHADGASPSEWSSDEAPASQSANNIGSGIADDHIDFAVASDGTLYSAIKTGFNKANYPLISLLVRRPSGTWDDLYEVSQTGTLPIVILNEEQDLIKVIYTSKTYGGDILYRESSTSNISFCKPFVLMNGNYNYATSTKQNYSSEIVILASTETHVVGVKAIDDPTLRSEADPFCDDAGELNDFIIYPNPSSSFVTVSFTLKENTDYSLTVYDSKGAKVGISMKGSAEAEKLNLVQLDGSALSKGLYLVRLQTSNDNSKTRKLVMEK